MIQDACVSLMIDVGKDWVSGETDVSRLHEHRDSLLHAHGLVSLTNRSNSSSNNNAAPDEPKPAPTKEIVRCTGKQPPGIATGRAANKKAETKAAPSKPAEQQQQLQSTGTQLQHTPPTTMAQLGIAKPSFFGEFTSDTDSD